jgi:hypothetical protein
MTKAVQQLIERINQMPEEEQEQYATWFLEELDDDAHWDRLLAGSGDVIDRMAEQALQAKAEGRTTDRFPRRP